MINRQRLSSWTGFALALAVFAGCGGTPQTQSAPATTVALTGLRGDADIATVGTAPEDRKVVKLDEGTFERSFEQQPPLLPHADYQITVSNNRCLDCHSDENYKEEEATQMGDSHFLQGKYVTTAKKVQVRQMSSQRYFCNQCHATQTDAVPPVGNAFTPVKN